MTNRTRLAAVGAVAIIGTGLLIAYQVRKASPPDQNQAAPSQHVINPDTAKAGQSAEPVPQLSQRTFEPLPSMGTGSYTDPAAASDKDSKSRDLKRKNDVVRAR